MANLVYRDEWSEVWHADCLDQEAVAAVLGDRRPDTAIVDAPYSARTHTGQQSGRLSPDQLASYANRQTSGARSREVRYAARKAAHGEQRRAIEYAPWLPADVERFVDLWSGLVTGWIVSLTDVALALHWESAYDVNGRCAFVPFPFVEMGRSVRMTGDGPANWGCLVCASRPRAKRFATWGALPGAYVVPGERKFNSSEGSVRIVGGKPLTGMEQLVRDYSEPGTLVVDQCCGSGTTLAAAKRLGRRAIGLDSIGEHCLIAAERLRRTNYVPGLIQERRRGRDEGTQGRLFDELKR